MNYATVCSGIEGASLAFQPLGWTANWFAEIDPFCISFLKHKYPEVSVYGRVAEISESVSRPDILCGGTPCQDFSSAGPRAGLNGKRGNVTLEFARLAGRLQSKWILWENVPGVLSVGGGNAFESFLREMESSGYGFAYRILDAQFFGVPQRRRRVYLIGCLGDWERPARVLFDGEGMSRIVTKNISTQEECTGPIQDRIEAYGGNNSRVLNVAPTLTACHNRYSTEDCYIWGSSGVRVLTPLERERLMGFPDGYTDVVLNGKRASVSARNKVIGNSWVVPVISWLGKRIMKENASFVPMV